MLNLKERIKRKRALYMQALFSALAFLMMVTIFYIFMSNNARRNLIKDTVSLMDYEQYKIESILQESQITLDSYSQTIRSMVLNGDNADKLQRYVRDLVVHLTKGNRYTVSVKGLYAYIERPPVGPVFISSYNEHPGNFNPTQTQWYQKAVAANGGIAEILTIEDSSEEGSIFTHAISLFDYEGQHLGVFCIDVRFRNIAETVVETADSYQNSVGFLIGHDMTIIAHNNPEFINMKMTSPLIPTSIFANELFSGKEVTERPVVSYRGEHSVAFFRSLPNGWFLGLTTPKGPYYENITRMALILFALGAAFAVILIIGLVRIDKNREKSEFANIQKSAFLANMSHEIRTPMNTILGIAEIQLRNKAISDNTREAISMMYESGELLLSIINDLLDMSKIEAGKMEIIPAEYDIASLINDVMMLNMIRVGSKPVEFKLFLNDNIPSVLYGDELRLKQILNNILSNAWKYTKKGMITLSISVEAESGKEGSNVMLTFKVSDTGIGMTRQQISKLFDEFVRFNMESNRTTEGTGLGMSITQNLVHMMNGEILVTSTVNLGSEFTVHIPQKRVGPDVLTRGMMENLQKFRLNSLKQIRTAQILIEPMPYGSILVVDDVDSNLFVAKGLMEPYKLNIDTVTSGHDAIDRIRSGRIYDIIFMDHMMPNMDGIVAAKLIRKLGYKKPIVALTANAVIGQADMFLSSGFDGFVSKPIDIRELNTLLRKFIRDKYPSEVVEAARQGVNADIKTTVEAEKPPIKPELVEIIISEITKTIAVLEDLYKKGDACSSKDLQLYIITFHGLRSSLANIGELELSGVAAKLEKIGRDNNFALLYAETPGFLDNLRALIGKLAPSPEDESDDAAADDLPYLREKLPAILAACSAFDKKTAEDLIAELGQKTWSTRLKKPLKNIAEQLLYSDFDKITSIIEDILKMI